MSTLAAYVATAILVWSPTSRHIREESPEDYVSRISELAGDIAFVAQDEAPAVASDDESHSKTAVLVATVGFFESNFMSYVISGNCNDASWRQSHQNILLNGDCDGGLAYGAYQVHPAEGLVLLPPEEGDWSRLFNFSAEWRSNPVNEASVIGGAEIISDFRVATRVAVHMLRKSLKGGGLCGYSGEAGPCPKANARLDFARRWWTAHPYVAED